MGTHVLLKIPKKKKSGELFFTKWKEKKCLKVKPLNKKKSRELFYKINFKKNKYVLF